VRKPNIPNASLTLFLAKVLGKIRKGLGVKRCRPNTSNAFTEIRGLYAKCFLKMAVLQKGQKMVLGTVF
jgi:hypothetical protein